VKVNVCNTILSDKEEGGCVAFYDFRGLIHASSLNQKMYPDSLLAQENCEYVMQFTSYFELLIFEIQEK